MRPEIARIFDSYDLEVQLQALRDAGSKVAAWEKWLSGETGGSKLRLDTYHGSPDITFFTLSKTDAEVQTLGALVRDEIEAEMRVDLQIP
jgi:hypothetical protein